MAASLALLCHLTDSTLTQRLPHVTLDDPSFIPLMDVVTDTASSVPAGQSSYFRFPLQFSALYKQLSLVYESNECKLLFTF